MDMTKEELETKLAENLRKMGGDAVVIAKSIVAKEANVVNLTEEEFTAVITSYAQKLYPNDRADVAFSKVFNANTQEGKTLMRAYDIVKALPPVLDFQPAVVDGVDAYHAALGDRSRAYDQLVDMARKMRGKAAQKRWGR